MENPIPRYLEDVIAAEQSFETQLRTFAKEASTASIRFLFEQHADETKLQYELLTARLTALGGSTSTLKSMMAHLFNFSPKLAQIGHKEEERTTQDLMMAFSVENAEVAMYQALIMAAESMGDSETAALAESIQQQEQQTADKVWNLIAPTAATAAMLLQESGLSDSGGAYQAGGSTPGRELIKTYVQDAEAAERNFEDALQSFSKMGEQTGVQSAMAMMSAKAKTQHERLQARLESLGGSPSTVKSLLAHLLAFTPVSAQIGHDSSEKSTQHLMIVYAAAAAEMAMYEALASAAEVLGDLTTTKLARELQSEEKEDHVIAWKLLSGSAISSTITVAAKA